MKLYNVGILANCCTHGAGICGMFKGRSDTHVIAAYEENPRRAKAVKTHNVHFVHDIPMVRFRPVYARLLEEVRVGVHGTVMGYHHLFGMNFPTDFELAVAWPERLDPPQKSGGGEMTNMGCYAVDYAVSLFGRPKTVTAKWRKLWDVFAEADVENFGQIVLDYGDFFAFLEVGKQQLTQGPSS